MTILEQIQESWGWIGIQPLEVIHENDFGNLIVKSADGKFWRLCPEECSCEVIATSGSQLDALWTDAEFLEDWNMQALVNTAVHVNGPLTPGRKHCLKIPAVMGGKYESANLATAPLLELIGMSGSIASQLRDLPDGAPIKLRIT